MKKSVNLIITIILDNNKYDYEKIFNEYKKAKKTRISIKNFNKIYNEAITVLKEFLENTKLFDTQNLKNITDKTNDKIDDFIIPRLFPEDTQSNDVKQEPKIKLDERKNDTSSDAPVEISSIQPKRKKIEKKSFSILSKQEFEQGFIELKENKEKIWFNMDKMNHYLQEVEKIYDNDDLYWQKYYKNMIMLNYIQNKKIFMSEDSFSKGLKWEEVFHYSPVISSIKEKSSNFYTFSKEYRDFIDSGELKNKEYFELIIEWKKGEGTKKYLNNFIKEIKEKINALYENINNEEIDMLIDNALKEWHRDKSTIPLFKKKIPFSTNVIAKSVLKEDNYFMQKEEWFKYNIPLSENDSLKDLENVKEEDEIKKILFRASRPQLREVYEKIAKEENEFSNFWVSKIFGLELTRENYEKVVTIFRMYTTQSQDIYLQDFISSKNYKDYLFRQDEWIFNFNKNTLESKKETIRKYLATKGIDID